MAMQALTVGDLVMTPDGPGRIVQVKQIDGRPLLGRRQPPAAYFMVVLENDGRRMSYPVGLVEPLEEFAP